MFELFLGGVVKHSKRAIALQVCIYDKSLIVTVESDTMETSLVYCLEHCYSCCALVTIRGNELVIFHGIALYSDDKYILLCSTADGIDLYVSYIELIIIIMLFIVDIYHYQSCTQFCN